MFSTVLAVLALSAVPSVFASVYVTAPVSGTSWAAGQSQTISWQDSGVSPSLAEFGLSKVSIYVGNEIQQTEVQTIANNVNVSTTSSIEFTPNPSVGATGSYYFIRFESSTLKNPNDTAYYEEAFSALFTLTGMTGTFNSSVQAEIDGTSTAPIGGVSTPAAAASTPTAAVTTTPAALHIASSASASPSGSAAGNAANGAPALATASKGLAAFVAVAAAGVGAMLL